MIQIWDSRRPQPGTTTLIMAIMGFLLITDQTHLRDNTITQEKHHATIKPDASHLLVTIQTDELGKMQLFAGNGQHDYAIDWDNDGIFDDTHQTGTATHYYDKPGIYTIRIKGTLQHITWCISPGNSNDENNWRIAKQQIHDVVQWGDIAWTSMRGMFAQCNKLQHWSARDTPNMTHVTDMSRMFESATRFNQPLNAWDVSNVRNMNSMFDFAIRFNQPLDHWDVSNVQNMSYMFNNADRFNQPLHTWDVSNVNQMSGMFAQTENFNQPLHTWNVSNARYLDHMFYRAQAFNSSLADWNLKSAVSLDSMFKEAIAFNQPLNTWNVSQVRNMSHMFAYTTSFNQPLDQWDIRYVHTTNYMFYRASSFSQPLDMWDIRHVQNMDHMFR